MIPRDTVGQILETARIEEVIGEFVTLKKRGANHIGLCPFHNEKTPSFSVSESKGIFNCFGCGVGGNVVNFVMEHEKYTYPEALRWLAGKYNVPIEEVVVTPEMEAEQGERESQYVVSEFAKDWFIKQLKETDEGKAIGLSYFKERGYTDETIEQFQLGYSPEDWEALTKYAQQSGFKLKYLLKTGLSKSKESRHYDGFRDRVIFPIHNISGRVIGFGGRVLKKAEKLAKYVNTPECDIYHKSKVLYGLYFSKKAIITEDNCLLVEGYTDVISMHQAGIQNVVASSGTSLTQDQIRLIKRYTPNVTILYDGDPAGIKASFRGIDLILEEGMNVKVVLFPEGEDPDSYAHKLDADELVTFIKDNAQDFITFKAGLLQESTKNDPVEKAKLIHEIVNSIALIPDHIARSLYVKECSKAMEIGERALISELNKARRTMAKRRSQREPDPESPVVSEEFHPKQFESIDSIDPQERDIIRLLMNYAGETLKFSMKGEEDEEQEIEVTVAEFLIGELQGDDIELANPLYKEVMDVFAAAKKGEWPDVQYFTNQENEALKLLAVDLVSERYELHNWEKHHIPVAIEAEQLLRAVHGAIYSFKTKRVAEMIRIVQEELKEKNSSGEEAFTLLKHQQKLDGIKLKLAAIQGRIILR